MLDEYRPAKRQTPEPAVMNEPICHVGQRVAIVEGPLAGWRATLVRRETNGYLMVELDELGEEDVFLWVDEAAISFLSND